MSLSLRTPSVVDRPRYLAPFSIYGLFFGFVIASHLFAVFQLQELQSEIVDRRFLKCARLVESIHGNAWWIAAYAIFVALALSFSIARRHPRWSTWILLTVFAAPWCYYLYACAYIAAVGA